MLVNGDAEGRRFSFIHEFAFFNSNDKQVLVRIKMRQECARRDTDPNDFKCWATASHTLFVCPSIFRNPTSQFATHYSSRHYPAATARCWKNLSGCRERTE